MHVCDVATTVQILGSKWKLLMELFVRTVHIKKFLYNSLMKEYSVDN